MSETLDETVLEHYSRETDEYRTRRELAIRLFSGIGKKKRFKRDLDQLATYLSNPTDDKLNRTISRAAGSDDFSELAKTIKQHEVELRVGQPFRRMYADMVYGILKDLHERAQYNGDSGRYRTMLDNLDKFLDVRLGNRTFLQKLSDDRMLVPMKDYPKKFISRNSAGFYRTEIALPFIEDDGNLTSVSVFSKFFGNAYDWRKNNGVSNYLAALGLPFKRVLALHSDGNGNHISTTAFVEGKEAAEVLLVERAAYEENLDYMKRMVEILAKTHVLGAAEKNQALFRSNVPRKIRTDMKQDLEADFIMNYVLRVVYSVEEMEQMGITHGQRPDKSVLRQARDKFMSRTSSEYHQLQEFYQKMNSKVVRRLTQEMERRERAGEIAFLTGDPHTGNFLVSDSGEITSIDPELAAFGLAEYDLYKLIEDGRDGFEAMGRADEARGELLQHYWRKVEDLRGINGMGFTDRMRDREMTFYTMRCLFDFTSHALFKEYSRPENGVIFTPSESAYFRKLAEKRFARGEHFLVSEGI